MDLDVEVPAGASLILEGPYLLDPRLRSRLERVVHLAIPSELTLRRVAGRARSPGPPPLERARMHDLPAQRAYEARYAPQRLADLVLDAASPFGALRSIGAGGAMGLMPPGPAG